MNWHRNSLIAVWTCVGVLHIAWSASFGIPNQVGRLLLYVIASLLMIRVHRMEARKRILRSFLRTRLAMASIALGTGILTIAGTASVGTFWVTAYLALIGLLTLRWGSDSTHSLARKVARVHLILASFLFSLGCLEFFCRTPLVLSKTGGNTPGTRKWEKENYDYLWLDNPDGFRSLHLDEPKTAETFRIVTIGDSFTWGDKIARTQDVWPYLVESQLRAHGMPVEVINLGRKGYTTVNEAEVLERFGWSFQPDLVILQSLINDTLPSGPDFERSVIRWVPLCAGWLGDFLDTNSYAYSFLNFHFQGIQRNLFYGTQHKLLFEDSFSGWKDCQAAFSSISQQCLERNVPILVVQFPLFSRGILRESTYPHLHEHRKLLQASGAVNLPTIDLLPVFCQLNRTGESWWALACDGHPNEEAHRIAADAIIVVMQQNGYLKLETSAAE